MLEIVLAGYCSVEAAHSRDGLLPAGTDAAHTEQVIRMSQRQPDDEPRQISPRRVGRCSAAGTWRGGASRLAVAAALVSGCLSCTVTNGDDVGQEANEASSDTDTTSATEAPSTTSGADVDWSQVAQDVESSVVSIAVQGDTGSGVGSGVIIDDRGHVLTNNHVVAAAGAGGELQISLSDARVFAAELVGADPDTDLAVLEMQDVPDDLTALEFGETEAVAVGDPVMAVGNPLGLSHTVTVGIVSALDRPVTTQNASASPFDAGTPVVTNAIQTDAAINPGNSGGALVDAGGRLIGINSSIASLGAAEGGQGGSIGLGFAIPANQAEWVVEGLIESGSVEHALLGVTPQNAVVEIDGVAREVAGIVDVVRDSPAAEAGLEPGDVVAAVDGEAVTGAESLVAQVRERRPGTKVTLTIVDEAGTTREVPVEFATRS